MITKRADRFGIERPAATAGRVALYFSVRYATPVVVLIALATSTRAVDLDRLTAVLTAQVAFALATHALATRSSEALGLAVGLGMVADVACVAVMVALTGGLDGPLVFLFTVHAMAAGVLLSSRAGIRHLLMSTAAILVVDVTTLSSTPGDARIPRGIGAAAALWILGGAATMFSAFNERELARRNAELATIRRVTLDIEETLSLQDIFTDLCRGVVEGFGFDAAAVLQRNGETLRCVGSHGVTGSADHEIELRGHLAAAMRAAVVQVVDGNSARREGGLTSLIGARGYVAVPVAEDGLLIVTRSGRRRAGAVRAHELDALDRLSHHARLAIANARLHAQVEEMAKTDPLTGLANHGEMQRRLASELAKVQRFATLRAAGHHPSVILIDIDHFKKLNDRYGHPAGDAVLKGVAGALRVAVRSFDVVARYGGEEFAVILPGTGEQAAREVAERIRRGVAAFPFRTRDGKRVRVTVSAGVASAPAQGAMPAQLIKAADSALYRAKLLGRNQVVHATEIAEKIAEVVPMDLTRRRRERDEGRARDAAPRARVRSSLPKRRTPRA